jgi:hypothetical protein
MNKLNIDPFHRFRWPISRQRLSLEDKAILGPLHQVEALSSNPEDVQRALMEAAGDDLNSGDLIRFTKAMGALRRAFELLVDQGFAFQPILADLEGKMDGLAKAGLQGLVRKYLSRGPQAEQAGKALCELIEQGYWKNWQQEYDDLVDQYAAERRVGR